tara:strand:+ start:2586 stop:2897 length:312 start_codon:yes stop_codon:yes gene_type:complete
MAFKMNYEKSTPSVIGFPGEKMNNIIEQTGNGNGKGGPKTQVVDRSKRIDELLSTDEGTKKIANILSTAETRRLSGVTEETQVNPNKKVFDEAIVINNEEKED